MGLSLDETVNESDTLIEENDIPLIYDDSVEAYLNNPVIDFTSTFFGESFTITGSSTSNC